ncbi:MAG: retention module-containing protein, partial [Halomonas sp.]|uniref:retention module-containing protein n=1 Tax=Halomonas sp. TaxID=1486246 RepID=UPI0019FBFEEC
MTIATVISIIGQAWARDADGNLRELRVGDTLQEGETLVTADNARVQLDFGDGLDPTLIDGGQQVVMTPELDAEQPVAASEFSALDEDLEALLTAIDEGEGDLLEALDATAAGAGPGGGADGGHSFVMLGRIAEDVNPLAFNFEGGQLAGIDFPEDVPEVLDEDFGVSISGLTLDGADLTVDEANLANGSNPDSGALVQTGSFVVSAPDGIATLSVGGAFIVQDGVLQSLPSITTDAGNVLAITGYTDNGDGTYTVEYSYTLNGAKDHSAPGDDSSLSQVFVVNAVDTDGDSATANLTIAVLDDVPTAVDDSASLAAGESVVDSGNLLVNDVEGADTARVTEVNGTAVPADGSVEVAGEYGVLTIEADGSFSYVRGEGTPGGVDDVFTYTLTDADGDSDTATLTIAIADAPVIINGLTAEGPDVTVDEANLPDGSMTNLDALVQTGSFTITALDGVANLSVGGEFVVQDGVLQSLPSITTEAGNELAITAYTDNGGGTYKVDYSYTLNSNKFHEQPDDDTELFQDFAVSVTDNDGDTASATLTVEILDDGPSVEVSAAAELDALLTTDAGLGTDSATLRDFFTLEEAVYGGDGAAESGAKTWSYSLVLAEAATGSVALDSDGNAITSGGADVYLHLVEG